MNDENGLTLEEAMEELSSAEDFLLYFDIPFDTTVVHVNRLHIMQRFHDYLAGSAGATGDHAGNDEAMKAAYAALLQRVEPGFRHGTGGGRAGRTIRELAAPRSAA